MNRSEVSLLPLFVYGTLMSEGPRAGLLGRGRRRVGRVPGVLFVMPTGYPALVLGSSGSVEGEVVDGLDEARMRMVDLYEGVPEGLYQRVDVDVEVDGRAVAAWAYVMPDAAARGGTRWPGSRWIQARGGQAEERSDRGRRGR